MGNRQSIVVDSESGGELGDEVTVARQHRIEDCLSGGKDSELGDEVADSTQPRLEHGLSTGKDVSDEKPRHSGEKWSELPHISLRPDCDYVYNEHAWEFTDTEKTVLADGSCVDRAVFIQQFPEAPAWSVCLNWPKDTHVFTLFPKLAPEIRRIIWKTALPGPRLLELRIGTLGDPFGHGDHCSVSQIDEDHICEADGRGLLAACQESRQYFLEHYQQIMLASLPSLEYQGEDDEYAVKGVHSDTPNYSYIDPKRDTLMVPLYFLNGDIPKDAFPDLSRVQNLCLPSTLFLNDNFRYSGLPTLFPNLRKLTINVGAGDARPNTSNFCHFLLEITNNFSSMVLENGSDGFFRQSQKENLKELCKLAAGNLKRMLRSVNVPYMASVKLKVALLATIHGDNFDSVRTAQNLKPVKPQYHGASFYTWRPFQGTINRKAWHKIKIAGLECETHCLFDGTLLYPDIYDDLGLERLFQET